MQLHSPFICWKRAGNISLSFLMAKTKEDNESFTGFGVHWIKTLLFMFLRPDVRKEGQHLDSILPAAITMSFL